MFKLSKSPFWSKKRHTWQETFTDFRVQKFYIIYHWLSKFFIDHFIVKIWPPYLQKSKECGKMWGKILKKAFHIFTHFIFRLFLSIFFKAFFSTFFPHMFSDFCWLIEVILLIWLDIYQCLKLELVNLTWLNGFENHSLVVTSLNMKWLLSVISFHQFWNPWMRAKLQTINVDCKMIKISLFYYPNIVV